MSDCWTRRRFLGTLPAIFGAGLPERSSRRPATSTSPKNGIIPFSRFFDIAEQAGLTQPTIYGEQGRATYIIEVMGAGCAFFDYDNDGWLDIFMLGGRRLEGTPTATSNRLYRNNRDGTFTDVTVKAGLTDSGWANGVCVGDYDNDGFEDLFITYYGQNRLYRNNGNGTFTDITASAGLIGPPKRFNSGCTFIDYNRDGLLDLFVSNYVEFDLATAPRPSMEIPNCNYEGVAVNCGPRGFGAPQHYLYRNNGDGTFTDVSKESGIAKVRGSFGLTAVTFDADADGWPDIFVACDTTPSLLLMNNHDGTFREEALLRGIALSNDGTELAGMGVGLGDYNLDGHLDVVRTHFQKQATGIYRNNGKGDFQDVTVATHLNREQRFISWGTGLVDLDNDGNPDIFVTTGTVYPELERISREYPARSPRIVFRNQGDGTFLQLDEEAGSGIMARHTSRGCAFGDFDNDGDLDIIIMNQNEPPSLLRNDAPAGNHWLKVRLEGTKSNRSAIGARVLVRYAERTQAQAVTSQASYLSANDPRLHFGLGKASVAEVEIYWPSGKTETYHGVTANQLVVVREGHGIVRSGPLPKS